jgi:carbon monoxide dehydrogenase subunit G
MIIVRGTYLIKASPDAIWRHIFDPTCLASIIPGCQQLEQTGPDEYRGVIRVGVPAVGGTYRTIVRILDQRAPDYCCFEGEVDGPTGSVGGTVSFALKEVASNSTELQYEARAMISGGLATLSSRLFEGVAQTLLKQGLARFDGQLRADLEESVHADR